MKAINGFFGWVGALLAFLALAGSSISNAAVFPTPASPAARLEIADTQGLLSWNPSTSPSTNLTVMFWAKISLPDTAGFQLAEDMTLLGNRRTGDWNANHAYRFYFNASTGNLEFSAKGTSGALPSVTLVERPYLDRWYHLAAVRTGAAGWNFYVDGRKVLLPLALPDIGSTATADGVSIGGLLTGQRFFGEIQEVAVFQSTLTQASINTNRFRDIPASSPGLRGYYKLGYSTVATDNLKNFAAAPTAPLVAVPAATKEGTGAIDFPEADKNGEQSLFDSQKNQGRDAISPLSGAFSWQRTLLSRPTPGVPFEFRIGYNNGTSFNSEALNEGATLYSGDAPLGPGWRHSFQTRLVPADDFLKGAPLDSNARPISIVGLLNWDGSLETWQKSSGQPYKTLHGEYRGEFLDGPSGSDSMLWVTPERIIYTFDTPANGGRLREIRDFSGNTVTLAYVTDPDRLDTVTDTAGNQWKFNYVPGQLSLLESVTSLGWRASFTYSTDAVPKLSTFYHRGPAVYETDPPLSTTWTMRYDGPNGLLTSIQTPAGPFDISVAYDKYGRKISETDGGNRSSSYQYLTPGPRQITRVDGDLFKWIDTFDRKGHVIAKADPLGNTTRFEYYSQTNGVPETNLAGGTPSSPGALKRQTEPLGWVTTFDTYDDRANLLQKTDALGYVWKWTFAKSSDPAGANGKLTDGSAPPVSSLLNRPLTDTRPHVAAEAEGLVWQNRYTYDTHGNLLRHEDDIGTLAEYTYNSHGQVETARDGNFTLANPSASSTAYDPVTGYRVSSTDPYHKITTYQTTELGWVKSATNPIGETVTSEFDINGRVVKTTDHAGHTVSTVIDPIGRQLSVTDAKNQKSESRYNGSNLRSQTTDRAGNITDYDYNQRSLPTITRSPAVPISQTTGAPLSERLTTLRSYDSAGRPLRETDPAGDYIEHTYDANGNETITRDKTGKLYRKQYDALNRVAVEIDPLGNTRGTTFDEAGRVLTISNPNGSITRHEYDGRGRLKKWTDPEGNVWIYTYDGVGNIKDIEDALHGHYLMTYDLRNARLTEKNQDGLEWIYTYDDLGRLKTQREPTGITRTLTYDAAGRLFLVNFSSGRLNVLSYDDNGNVWTATRIDAGTQLTTFTTFAYDSLDRPVYSNDVFGKKVEYGYDALSRVTSLTYPGGKVLSQEFDNRSRMVRQTTPSDWGSHTLTYAWDQEGRLTGQTYPNGITRAASYDDSGRQTALSYTDPSNNASQIALSYGYDHNGNQTSAKEKGLPAYTPPAAHDETSAYTDAGRIKTRTDAADPTGARNWNYEFKNADNTPSFNLSKATNSTVGSLALTYDEDNRTTQLVVTPPAGPSSTTSNRYDAMGRRISRTLTTPVNAAGETRYVLNLVGGMERVLADTNASGTISSYYIHGPDLAVKIDANDPTQITCFHSDASGNIVRLTDKTRATVSQYAYSDYGRPFATTASGNADANPYRFVGSQGVMEEPILPGLYFMRARYYLADAGVFLSVDPVKNIGPGWKPESYGYANSNPIKNGDSDGNEVCPFSVNPLELAGCAYGYYGGGGYSAGRRVNIMSVEQFITNSQGVAPLDAEDQLYYDHDLYYAALKNSNFLVRSIGSIDADQKLAYGLSHLLTAPGRDVIRRAEITFGFSSGIASAYNIGSDALNSAGSFANKIASNLTRPDPITSNGGSHANSTPQISFPISSGGSSGGSASSGAKSSSITATTAFKTATVTNATSPSNSFNSVSSYKPQTTTAGSTQIVASSISGGGGLLQSISNGIKSTGKAIGNVASSISSAINSFFVGGKK